MRKSRSSAPVQHSSAIQEFSGAGGLIPENITAFRTIIYHHYEENGRDFPWRYSPDPYHILVSEIMLQQTQTSRVAIKYPQFLEEFPDISSLAAAPLSRVLQAWQGLGYNRRAVAMQKIAREVVNKYGGKIPGSPEILVTLPGIGKYTAAAIAAFAFNQPTVLIETNIRAVFIHFFFPHRYSVSDKEIKPLVERTLDRENPCRWYYALFDYGVLLKKSENPAVKSAHYRKQSPFKGSNRELRSQIIRLLLDHPELTGDEIGSLLSGDVNLVKQNLSRMAKEGLVMMDDSQGKYSINH